VERICKYPPSIDRNRTFYAEEQSIQTSSRFVSRLDSKEYMRRVRANESQSFQDLSHY